MREVIEQTAKRLGVSGGAIRQWRARGKVPHHIRFDLSEEAKREGHKLKHPDFENFGKEDD